LTFVTLYWFSVRGSSIAILPILINSPPVPGSSGSLLKAGEAFVEE
jgi:hypothetical protein